MGSYYITQCNIEVLANTRTPAASSTQTHTLISSELHWSSMQNLLLPPNLLPCPRPQFQQALPGHSNRESKEANGRSSPLPPNSQSHPKLCSRLSIIASPDSLPPFTGDEVSRLQWNILLSFLLWIPDVTPLQSFPIPKCQNSIPRNTFYLEPPVTTPFRTPEEFSKWQCTASTLS